jgi:insecticidal toxin complex protein TccC
VPITTLYTRTPAITVTGPRGQVIRSLAWCRTQAGGAADLRLTRSQFDDAGRPLSQADPRLGSLDTPLANLTFLSSPTGLPLRTLSVDAGRQIVLSDAEGRPCRQQDALGTLTTWHYEAYAATDAQPLPGRLLAVQEQAAGTSAAHTTQQVIYADRSGTAVAENQARNRCGQAVRHYDTAGLVTLDRAALSGAVLQQSRTLLQDALDDVDWAGEAESLWLTSLEQGDDACHITRTTVNALGVPLTQTDAAGHLQRMAVNVAGRLSGSWLTLNGGSEQPVLVSLTWSAAGQKLQEVHGNGVTTDYTYEPQTQRLTGITTTRAASATVTGTVLQDLRYAYDPVGNVLTVSNDAEETRFWRNQKVVPESTYAYDSLYQLLSATGRENATAGQQSPHLPTLITPLPADSSQYTNYTRTYTYDTGGNLMQIQHSAPATNNNYTTTLTVSDKSNRAVLSSLTADASKVDGYFDTAGHQLNLGFSTTGNLVWDPRGNLRSVTTVSRTTGSDAGATTNDGERYRYDGQSQRQRKLSRQQTGNGAQSQRVTYLAGLELRVTQTGDTTTEGLQVITVGEAGRAQVRVLHWENGKPDGIDNDQVRYSYDNLIGSSGLEVGGDGQIISQEEYYPYGGTAVWTARSNIEAGYKTVRYSGKERDATGLYYYGYRYYQPWAGRWLSADPAGTVDGLNLFRMVRNNPVVMHDPDGKGAHSTKQGVNSETEKNVFEQLERARTRASERMVSAINVLENYLAPGAKGNDPVTPVINMFFGEGSDTHEFREKWLGDIKNLHSHINHALDININVRIIKSHNQPTPFFVYPELFESNRQSKYAVLVKKTWEEIGVNTKLSADTQAIVFAHEMSHLVLKTKDFGYVGISERTNDEGYHNLKTIYHIAQGNRTALLKGDILPGSALSDYRDDLLRAMKRVEKGEKDAEELNDQLRQNTAYNNADSFTYALFYLAYSQQKPDQHELIKGNRLRLKISP